MGTKQKKSTGKISSIQGKPPPQARARKRQAVAIRVERCENRMKLGITVEGKFSLPRVIAAFILVAPIVFSSVKVLCTAAKELGLLR